MMNSLDALAADATGAKVAKRAPAPQKSRATSCERCKRRKQKCDHRLPICTNCLRAGETCVQPEKYAQSVPQKDQYTILLEEKLAELQSEVSRLRQRPGATMSATVTASHGSNGHDSQSQQHHGHTHHGSFSSAANVSNPPTPSNGLVNQLSPLSTSGSTPGSEHSVKSRNAHSTVNILHSDPASGAQAPQSFSVVSSLLRESFWGRNGNDTDHNRTNVPDGSGLLPNYNFDAYLSARPIETPDEKDGKLLLEHYFNVQGKFSFIDHAFFVRIHEQRHNPPVNIDDPNYRLNNFLLFAVYALTIVLQPPPGQLNKLDAKRYYSTALRHAKLCKSTDSIWQIKALLLCAMYQMRTDIDDGCHFDMVNRSMKLCSEIGLHVGRGFNKLSLYEQEMRKRVFWCVYGLERLYTISTGRPFSVAENDITLDFPVELDYEDLTEENIAAARLRREQGTEESSRDPNRPPKKFSFVLYVWRLRRLESDMVTNIYQRGRPLEEIFTKVDYYLSRLKAWQEEHTRFDPREQTIASIAYSKAVRLLLQPFLASLDPTGPLFKKCVAETGRICLVFRDFYRKYEQGFTTIAMHTNFIAGLTLIYCLWLAKDTDFLPILENIRMCTSSLYILTERSRLCRNYRDTFENLVTTTIKTVNEHSHSILASRSTQNDAGMTVGPGTPTSIFHNITPSVQQTMAQNQADQADQTAQAQASAMPAIPQTVYPAGGANPSVVEPTIKAQDPANAPTTNAAETNSNAVNSEVTPVVTPSLATPTNGNGSTAVPFEDWKPNPNPNPNPNPTPNPDGKGWTDNYGYDDSIFNMIQDISSWTKQSAEPDTSQITDHMWLTLTDFSLT